jgi:hypothetical protein
MMTPAFDDFKKTLLEEFSQAKEQGLSSITIKAGELHKKTTGKTLQSNHRMPLCCKCMNHEFVESCDIIKYTPPKGEGSCLKIEYKIPRPPQ